MTRFARGRAALAGVGFRGEVQQESTKPGRDCIFERSDLKAEWGRQGSARSAQLTDQRLLVADRGEDCDAQKTGLRGNGEIEGRAAKPQLGNRQADGAGRGDFDEMGDGRGAATRASGLKARIEEDQAQDLDLNWNLDEKWEVNREKRRGEPGVTRGCTRGLDLQKGFFRTDLYDSNANSKADQNSNARPAVNLNSLSERPRPGESQSQANSRFVGRSREGCAEPAVEVTPTVKNFRSSELRTGNEPVRGAGSYAWREKDLAVEKELRVGQGPVCGPARVKPEVLERIRRREAARAGSRSP
jgi:hypothetical protein